MATSFEQARRIAADIGYPVLVRPSYVLGGRGMEIVYDDETLQGYITRATELSPEHPVLVDRFLEDAIEIDVDALCDGTEVYIGGVMEHIEEAGIHSGDSACALPPVTLGRSDIESVRRATEAIAHGIGVVGLLNVQYALKDDVLYVLEANPRASRTVPFVSKATAVPLAKACARIMLGATIAQLREEGLLAPTGDGAQRRAERADRRQGGRAAVPPVPHAPTARSVDSLLGPEMKSTGEVMGIDRDFGSAFAKSQTAAYGSLPTSGHGVRVGGQPGQAIAGVPGEAAGRSRASGCWPPRAPRRCCAATAFRATRFASTSKRRSRAGPPMSAVDAIRAGEVDMVINTPYGNSGSAHRRLRDPLGRSADEHSLRHDGAGRLGRRAGHRGGYPRRHRCALAAGTAQRAGDGGNSGGRVRRPAGRRGIPAAGPLCLGIDPHPELLARLGPAGRRRRPGGVLRDLRRGLRRLRRGQAAGRVLRDATARQGMRCWSGRSPRCATRVCWCWPTPNAATSARRWRPTRPPGRAIRRWPPTR